jgi:hypothetical protein
LIKKKKHSIKRSTCDKSASSTPDLQGTGFTVIFIGPDCESSFSNEVVQTYKLDTSIFRVTKRANTINTVIKSSGWSVLDCYTILNLDNGQFGLILTGADGTMQKSISIETLDVTITSSSYDASTGYFQVQLYIRFKRNFPSINRGDVMILNSVYNPTTNLFQTTAQYQVTPNPVAQTNHSSDKSRRHKNVKTSHNGSCKSVSDNVYVCYNRDKSRK